MASSEETEQKSKEDPSSTQKDTSSESPRQKLITTAITFLQNPKVKTSPLWQRKAFLKKKGLTDEEINIAVEKSGISDKDDNKYIGNSASSGSEVTVVEPAKPSVLSSIYHVTSTVSMVTGLAFAAYQFYQRFIKPFIFGLPTPEERLEKLEKSTEELDGTLLQTLKKIQETLNSVQDVLIKQDKLQAVVHGNELERSKLQNEQTVNEIKSEIQSIKGLLLSRKQFPPAPASKPSLPTWQLTDSVSSSSSIVSGSDSSATPVNSSENQVGGGNSVDSHLKSVESEETTPTNESQASDSCSTPTENLSTNETEEAKPELKANGIVEELQPNSDAKGQTNVNLSVNDMVNSKSGLKNSANVFSEYEVVNSETSITHSC